MKKYKKKIRAFTKSKAIKKKVEKSIEKKIRKKSKKKYGIIITTRNELDSPPD